MDFCFFCKRAVFYMKISMNKCLASHCTFIFPFTFTIRYDPKTDTWTMVAPLSMPRDAVGVCLLGDRLYAVGGYDGQTYLNTMEAYDPQTNEWTQVIFKSVIFLMHFDNFSGKKDYFYEKYFGILDCYDCKSIPNTFFFQLLC